MTGGGVVDSSTFTDSTATVRLVVCGWLLQFDLLEWLVHPLSFL